MSKRSRWMFGAFLLAFVLGIGVCHSLSFEEIVIPVFFAGIVLGSVGSEDGNKSITMVTGIILQPILMGALFCLGLLGDATVGRVASMYFLWPFAILASHGVALGAVVSLGPYLLIYLGGPVLSVIGWYFGFQLTKKHDQAIGGSLR